MEKKGGEYSARKQRERSSMRLSRAIWRTLLVFRIQASSQMKGVYQQGERTMKMEKTASLEAVTTA